MTMKQAFKYWNTVIKNRDVKDLVLNEISRNEFLNSVKMIEQQLKVIVKNNPDIVLYDMLNKLTDYELFIYIANKSMKFNSFKGSLENAQLHVLDKDRVAMLELFSDNDSCILNMHESDNKDIYELFILK